MRIMVIFIIVNYSHVNVLHKIEICYYLESVLFNFFFVMFDYPFLFFKITFAEEEILTKP